MFLIQFEDESKMTAAFSWVVHTQ